MELADTSAWVWTRRVGGVLRERFDERLVEGELATCDMVRLELLHSVRSGREFAQRRSDLARLPDCPVGREEWERALDVYEQLAHQGGADERSVKHPDLLIAAAAEAPTVPVLHYDEDYERIAAITGQATIWLAPRGSLR